MYSMCQDPDMAQDPSSRPLSDNLGYVLKQAQTALHAAMEAALRPHGLTLSQYSCLEQLSRAPGQSNAELARATFVTPQSMHDVLRGLQRRGLVERPATAPSGRSRPTSLTAEGQQALAKARLALEPVQQVVDSVAEAPEHSRLLAGLRSLIAALDAVRTPDGAGD